MNLKNRINMDDELRDLAEIMREETEKQQSEWAKTKEELNGLIEPKYFEFAETHESYGNEGIVNIVEVKERTQGYSQYPHCKEFDANERRLYIYHTTTLETDNGESKYEGSDIEYWVWQTVGYCGDDYSGFLLLPMLDGRYWKINYSC